MDNIRQKITEAIGEGTMGSASGIIGGLYFTENTFIIVVLGGIGAIIGRVLFPIMIEKFPKLNIQNKTLFKMNGKITVSLIIGLLLFSSYGYLTIDNYVKGQYLYTTTNVKLKNSPGTGGTEVTILKPNSKVIYLDKNWKRIRWHEDGQKFFNFWRKVKDQNGRIGWIYGGYLEEF